MTNNKPLLIVVVGPTGCGKTDLSIQIATRFNAPIISTDSRQVYRGMAIGTAQPTADQLAAVQHYLIANHEITDNYNCGDYEKEALETLDMLWQSHPIVVAVGGSGLYVDALCYGMDNLPPADLVLRQQLKSRLQNDGLDSLLAELKLLDPEYYNAVDHNNPQRVLRAIEVCIQTATPYSTLRKGNKTERCFRTIKIGIKIDREVLYDRINSRVDSMIEGGLEAEARSLYPFREINSLQTVGYRELFDYFDGNITLPEAIELIKRNTRRYAKRQMTWFNRNESIQWFDPTKTQV